MMDAVRWEEPPESIPAPRSEVHSSLSDDGNTDVTPKAPPRAPARVYSEATSGQSAPQSGRNDIDPEDVNGDAPDSSLWGLFREWITPPEIWSEGNRPLKDEWDYATNGAWTSDAGMIRKAGQLYALCVVFPVYAVADYLKWIVKRPTRLAAAVVVFTLLLQFPPMSWFI